VAGRTQHGKAGGLQEQARQTPGRMGTDISDPALGQKERPDHL